MSRWAFDVGPQIGEGGMARVYRGTHRRTGAAVALKVVAPHLARRRDGRRAFLAEVRAVARLDHPGVVRVLDAGEVPAGVEPLPEGAPYLVMPLHTPAVGLDTAYPFARLRRLLLELLDALAHAHARGLIHRDLKPSNLLLDARGRLVLTDFGIAHAWGEEQDDRLTGTPQYMAPEQARSAWRDFGPWTDLYAVGCLAYALTVGRPLFDGRPTRVLVDQLDTVPPPLQPRLPVPDGFEAWLGRLLAKAPGARYQRAAEAAWALAELPEVDDVQPVTSPAEHAVGPTLTWLADFTAPVGEPSEVGGGGQADARAPLPGSWRGPFEAPPAILRDAGLGLFALRTPPLRGQAQLRDRLWRAARLAEGGARRAVILRGPPGAGASRLATWLAHRLHALGHAEVLAASADPAEDALEAALHRRLGTHGLSATARQTRLAALLGSGPLAEAADGVLSEGAVHAGTLRTPAERFSVAERVLRTLAADRLPVVVLDDADADASLVALAEHLLAGHGPLLLLLTAHPTPGDADLAALEARPETDVLEVGPLPDGDLAAVLDALVPLTTALRARVLEYAAGRPGRALDLVRAWLADGSVQPSAAGLVARARLDPPHGADGAWVRRLAPLLRPLAPEARQALEVAAVLGASGFDEGRWRRLGRRLGLPVRGALLERLASDGLIRAGGGRWHFAHPAVPRHLTEQARRQGRLARWHAACAAALADEARTGPEFERLGLHRQVVGDVAGALAAFGVAFDAALAVGQPERAAASLAGWRDAARRLPAADPRVGRAQLLLARLAAARGEPGEARHAALALIEAAHSQGWPGLWAEAQVRVITADIEQGQLAEAEARLAALRPHVGATPTRLSADVARLDATLAHLQGRPEAVLVAAQRARQGYEALGAPDDAARALVYAGLAHKALGDLAGAEHSLAAARARFAARGLQPQLADCENILGDLHRVRGDLDGAARLYRAAAERFDSVGQALGALFPRLNLGMVLQMRGHHAEAGRALSRCLRVAQRLEHRIAEIATRLLLLPTVVAEGDATAWDQHWAAVAEGLGVTGWVDLDLARGAELAARAAEGAGDQARADAAWRLAAEQWASLARPADAARCRGRLGR